METANNTKERSQEVSSNSSPVVAQGIKAYVAEVRTVTEVQDMLISSVVFFN